MIIILDGNARREWRYSILHSAAQALCNQFFLCEDLRFRASLLNFRLGSVC